MTDFTAHKKLKTVIATFAVSSVFLISCGSNKSTTTTSTTSIASTTTTTTIPQPSVDKDLILNALCTGIPEIGAMAVAGGLDIWRCKRGNTEISLIIPDTKEGAGWFEHVKKQIADKVINTDSIICGDGWSVESTANDADSWYQALKKVNISTKYCY